MNVPIITIDMCERNLQKRFAELAAYKEQIREGIDAFMKEPKISAATWEFGAAFGLKKGMSL